MMRTLRTVLPLIATFVILAVPGYADSASATMAISVQVIGRTLLTVGSQPASVEVTQSDIQRGYIDVPAAVAFQVRSNAREGYSLQFEPVSGPFAQAKVTWENSTAAIGADGSWLTHGYQQGTMAGRLDVRLVLAAGATPGSYSWPVRFAAESL
ncbi:MAG: hypothetical protein DMF57_16005 [Acidobacteria bacterium]|nr:MAG: hypothetical protein DMF57_16005 [Acidobacteriota bacterium]